MLFHSLLLLATFQVQETSPAASCMPHRNGRVPPTATAVRVSRAPRESTATSMTRLDHGDARERRASAAMCRATENRPPRTRRSASSTTTTPCTSEPASSIATGPRVPPALPARFLRRVQRRVLRDDRLLSRSHHGVHLRRDARGRTARRHPERRRQLHRRLLGPGLGSEDHGRFPRLGRRDAHSLLAAPIPQHDESRLGRPVPARHPRGRRSSGLVVVATHGGGRHVEVGSPRRHQQHPAAEAPRSAALQRGQDDACRQRRARATRSTMDRCRT